MSGVLERDVYHISDKYIVNKPELLRCAEIKKFPLNYFSLNTLSQIREETHNSLKDLSIVFNGWKWVSGIRKVHTNINNKKRSGCVIFCKEGDYVYLADHRAKIANKKIFMWKCGTAQTKFW